MPIVQQLASKGPRMIYAPGLWLVVGLVLGWILCRLGLG
jgi:hypothetical protein